MPYRALVEKHLTQAEVFIHDIEERKEEPSRRWRRRVAIPNTPRLCCVC
jgi:hypothetical protein